MAHWLTGCHIGLLATLWLLGRLTDLLTGWMAYSHYLLTADKFTVWLAVQGYPTQKTPGWSNKKLKSGPSFATKQINIAASTNQIHMIMHSWLCVFLLAHLRSKFCHLINQKPLSPSLKPAILDHILLSTETNNPHQNVHPHEIGGRLLFPFSYVCVSRALSAKNPD